MQVHSYLGRRLPPLVAEYIECETPMKALIFGVSALVLNGFLSIQAIAHPPAYGPDGLIPHSHTGDGTTITGSAVIASHNDCPEATLPAILGVQTEGPCIRVNHGRPISHHVSAPDHEPVLIPTSRPFVRQVCVR